MPSPFGKPDPLPLASALAFLSFRLRRCCGVPEAHIVAMGSSIAVGVAIGVAIGLIIDNVAAGIGIGIAIGMGIAMSGRG